MIKVIVYVEGGVVQSVVANTKDIDVEIFDADNLLEMEGYTRKRVEEEWEIASKHKEIIY